MRETIGYVLILLLVAALAAGAFYFWYRSAGQRYRRHAARIRAKRSEEQADVGS